MSKAAKRRRSEKRRARKREQRARRRAASRRPALAALTSSALALPGIAGSASAGSPVEKIGADYNFSYYSEDAIDGVLVEGEESDSERYEIQTHQFHVESPLTKRTDFGVDVLYENMSGASPWFIQPLGEEALQVMSGATIEDQRTDVLANGNYYFDDAVANVGAGVSWENDYLAINGGLGGDMEFFEGNTTASLGSGFSIDTITPTDADEFTTRPEEEKKQSFSFFAGVSQILGRATAVQANLTYQLQNGYLDDPYKLAWVGPPGSGTTVADTRPDTRNQLTILTRLRHHFEPIEASLHLNYQFYRDDWDITSHSAEIAWYQTLWDTVRVIPSFRYYTQSNAYFYAPFYGAERGDGLSSSDYRLSPYGAISWRLRAEKHFRNWFGRFNWFLGVSWERYLSGEQYAVQAIEFENPGLVDFNLVTVSVTGRF